MTVLVSSTTRGYKATGAGDRSTGILSWLAWAERWHADSHAFFLAVQRDRAYDDAMDGLADLVRSVDGTVWSFTIDEGDTTVTNSGRLAGICMGRNLAHEYAQRDPAISHILFLDTDVAPPVDCIERLLEVDHPLVAAHIPMYGRDGPKVDRYAPMDVREHWSPAGCILVAREAFIRLRWRWSLSDGMTDDPSFAADALALGWPTYVRHDVTAQHWPPAIAGFDLRGHDLKIGEG